MSLLGCDLVACILAEGVGRVLGFMPLGIRRCVQVIDRSSCCHAEVQCLNFYFNMHGAVPRLSNEGWAMRMVMMANLLGTFDRWWILLGNIGLPKAMNFTLCFLFRYCLSTEK
jgi:hypothetical protein